MGQIFLYHIDLPFRETENGFTQDEQIGVNL